MDVVARLQAWADAFQQRRTWAGFPFAVVKKYGDDGAGREAALITYYGFLSLFPALLLVVWVVSRVLSGNPELSAELIEAIVPDDLQPQVTSAVAALPTSGVPAVVGLLGLFFAGMGVVTSAYHTLNHLAGVPHRERFDFVPRYLRIVAALLVMLVGAFAVGAIGVLPAVLEALPFVDSVPRVGTGSVVALSAGSAALLFVLILVAVRLLVCRPVRFAAVWPGALLGALLVTLVLNLGGAVLAALVQKSGAVYGAFATVVGAFSLLYLTSQGLLYAAEIAVVRRRRLWPRSLDASRPLEADRRVLAALAREQERIAPQRVSTRFDSQGPREPQG